MGISPDSPVSSHQKIGNSDFCILARMTAAQRLVLILLLSPLAGMADTFELQDPAAEIYQEQQNPQEPEHDEKSQVVLEEIFCAVDEKEGKCWCVHKETAKVVAIEHEKCVMHASRKSSSEH